MRSSKDLLIYLVTTLVTLSECYDITMTTNSCLNDKLELLKTDIYRNFEEVSTIRTIRDARMMSYNSYSAEILLMDYRGDMRRDRYLSYKQTLRIKNHHNISDTVEEDGLEGPRVETVGKIEDVSNVLMWDSHDSGLSARLYFEESEQYLMVNTTNSRTSCTLRLSMYNYHGKVLTDDVFGVFKFSPDGKYLLYMAEQIIDPKKRFLYQGSFGETVDGAVRPNIIIYEISSLSFHTLEHVPFNYTVGQLSWRADSSGLVGVVWPNNPFPMTCPECANRESQIFTTDLGMDRQPPKFLILTQSNRHVFAPRLTPNGVTLVYFENDLKSNDNEGQVDYFIIPGPMDISRRLVRMDLGFAIAAMKRLGGKLPGNLELGDVAVEQVYYPYVQPDGTTFAGLYPKFPLPQRCFSHHGSIFYLSIYAKESLRLIAIDIFTGQVTFHPQKDIYLLDATNDALLVVHGDLRDSPSLRYASLHGDSYVSHTTQRPSTTSSTMKTTRRPSTTSKPGGSTMYPTTTMYPTSTIYDPCEHMLTEINYGNANGDDDDGDDDDYDNYNGGGGHGGGHRPHTSTVNPFIVPLPLAAKRFYALTLYETQDVLVEVLDFEVNGTVPSSRRTVKQLTELQDFNAIYVSPNQTFEDQSLPLVVDIHDGPHGISTTGFQVRAKTLLKLGYAVLMINYRGSKGNGDATLQSILGNIAKNDLYDCNYAINWTLTNKTELNPSKVAILGQGLFGGFIATHLNIRYPDLYSLLLLVNPGTDLSALASHSEAQGLPWQMLGINLTNLNLPSDIDVLAWQKSPLSNVDGMKGNFAIFVGGKDKIVVPRPQGIALHKALHYRDVPTDLYFYPDCGHDLNSLEVTGHMLYRSLRWANFHWRTYAAECNLRSLATNFKSALKMGARSINLQAEVPNTNSVSQPRRLVEEETSSTPNPGAAVRSETTSGMATASETSTHKNAITSTAASSRLAGHKEDGVATSGALSGVPISIILLYLLLFIHVIFMGGWLIFKMY